MAVRHGVDADEQRHRGLFEESLDFRIAYQGINTGSRGKREQAHTRLGVASGLDDGF